MSVEPSRGRWQRPTAHLHWLTAGLCSWAKLATCHCVCKLSFYARFPKPTFQGIFLEALSDHHFSW